MWYYCNNCCCCCCFQRCFTQIVIRVVVLLIDMIGFCGHFILYESCLYLVSVILLVLGDFFFVFLGGGYAMSKVQTRFYGFFCFRSHIPRHKDVGHNPKQQNVFKQLGKKTIVGLIPSSSWFNVESMFRRKVWFTLWKMLVTSLCSLVSLGYSTPSPDSCWEWQAHKLTINCAKNHSEYRWLWWTLKKWFIWRWIRSSVKSLTWV